MFIQNYEFQGLYVPLRLPKLYINNTEIKREISIKYLGALLEDTLTWKPHIEKN